MIIGFIGIATGCIAFIKGQDQQNAMFNLFVGGTLFGTALINYLKWKGKDESEC
jgi:hypothetical protein